MAETDYKCLYSIGPGSVGPGTSVRFSALDPDRNSGVLTTMHRNSSGLVPADLAALYQKSPTIFPGTSITLRDTTVRQMTDQLALIVSRYGGTGGGVNFKTVMTRTPGGYRQEPYWQVGDNYTKNPEKYSGSGVTRKLLPERILTIPLVTVRWSSIVYSGSRPSDNQSAIGKVNSGSKTIDGYTHADSTLKFEGTQIRHDKHGGYDRWTITHSASYDPLYFHKTSVGPIRGESWKDPKNPETFQYTLFNNGNGTQHHESISFSNIN